MVGEGVNEWIKGMKRMKVMQFNIHKSLHLYYTHGGITFKQVKNAQNLQGWWGSGRIRIQIIDGKRMKAVGYADTRPKRPNKHPDGKGIPLNRAQNRRVTIQILQY